MRVLAVLFLAAHALASLTTYKYLNDILSPEIVNMMEEEIGLYTNRYRMGNLSAMLYRCFPNPRDPTCKYTCKAWRKTHAMGKSFSLQCSFTAYSKPHKIHWIVGLSNKCVAVSLDGELIFDDCRRDDSDSFEHLDFDSSSGSESTDRK